MLYVFQVDTGTMLTFEMKVALESVANLKTVIASVCHIPEEKQVLLISGGENLDSHLRVCSYSAGTDTNPIFLFSKLYIESATPPIPSVDRDPGNLDMKEQVEATLNLPPTYNAVVSRSQMAQQLYDLAKDQMRICERLVHDQHLQQQGWAAVVANLEDIISAFRTRTELFQEKFQSYLETRQFYLTILQNFHNDLDLLGQIPILPSLLYNSSDPQEVMTLLQWISIKDNQSSLGQITDQANQGLEQFDEALLMEMKEEMNAALESANRANMKEVKGLEERLYGLEQLIHQAQKLVQGQSELAQAFLQNQQRASNLGDASILPDLCASHKNQLKMMLTNHKQLTDIRQRIFIAKEELSSNLHARLRWIMYVEMTMCEIDNKTMIYHERIKRLKNILEIVNQIHLAPKLYIASVVEVVRRKNFSTNFLKWATELSSKSQEFHEKEISLREEFSCTISHHFLNTLFPGLHDFPPRFATESPIPFDANLPNISIKDIEHLKQVLPDMVDDLRVPDINVISDITPKYIMDSDEEKRKNINANNLLSSTASPLQDSQQTLTAQSVLQPCPDYNKFSRNEIVQPSPLPPSSLSEQDHDEIENDFQSLAPASDLKCSIGSEMIKTKEAISNLISPIESKDKSACNDAKEHESSEDSQNLVERNLTPDSVATTSQDFLTADFYIDESMPSSYTESNGTVGHKNESTMKKSHHVIVAELQQKLEEKNTLIMNLQQELHQYKGTLERSEEKLKLLKELEEKTRHDLKDDISSVGKQLENDRKEFSKFVDTLSQRLHSVILSVEQRLDDEHKTVIQAAIECTKKEYDELLLKKQEILELEINKIKVAQQEIGIYQEQLQNKDRVLENLKQEYELRISEIQETSDADKAELIKNLTIEHELDLDKLKSEFIADLETKDNEIKKLQETMSEKLDLVDSLVKEKSTIELCMNEKFHEEKNQLIKIVLEEQEEKCIQTVNEMKAYLTEKYEKEIDELKLSQLEQFNQEKNALVQNNLTKTKELEDAYKKIEKDLEFRFQQEKTKELEVLQEQLVRDHNQMLDNLRGHFRVLYTTFIEEIDSPTFDPLTEVDQFLYRLKEKIEEKTTKAMEEAVVEITNKMQEESLLSVEQILCEEKERHKEETLKAVNAALEVEQLQHLEDKVEAVRLAVETEGSRHKEEINKITENLRKDNLEAVKSMKASMLAEKQFTFNMALNRVTSEKDEIIQQLQQKLDNLQMDLYSEREITKNFLNGTLDLSDFKEKKLAEIMQTEKILREKISKLTSDLAEANKRIEELQVINDMNASVATISDSSVSSNAPCRVKERIQELELTLKNKEEELLKLQQCMKDTAVSSSTVSLIQSDKVSIVSCSVGDIILFFYEEKYENYLAFLVKSALHFLHSDCISLLGLNSESGARKPWVIAEVTDKEYCQAKKSQNRFHVSVGTKFYRVKAKPWDKEAVVRKDQSRRVNP